MSQVDALFRLLTEAPPRSAEIVRRVALDGLALEQVAQLFNVGLPEAEVLVFRALVDVRSGGSERVRDGAERDGVRERELLELLKAHRAPLQARLAEAAQAYAASPDRNRDEWLRRLAIVVVLALTAFFYWREQHKPRPPPEKRPTVQPASP